MTKLEGMALWGHWFKLGAIDVQELDVAARFEHRRCTGCSGHMQYSEEGLTEEITCKYCGIAYARIKPDEFLSVDALWADYKKDGE